MSKGMVYVCDRCKKKTDSFGKMNEIEVPSADWDLCNPCYKKLVEFIENRK